MADPVELYVSSVRAEYETRLREWVSIPSVSASPAHRSDIDRCAAAAVSYLKSLGATAEAVQTSGNPVVWGRFEDDPSKPTVTVYNHLDVQPADEPEWSSNPFELEIRADQYFGRGTTDDKGPALAALLAARYSNQHGVPLNLQFIWEFEEEIGSPNFEGFIQDRLANLQTDSVVISDTIWISRDRPAIPYGLRGLITFTISLETGSRDVHSGLAGGGARNPINELCAVIGRCYDVETGRILVPGFYENVLPTDPVEIQGFLDSGFTCDGFQEAHELKSLRHKTPAKLVRQLWTRPTFEVHGIVGGYTGPGVKTSIAPRAQAKISMRLVPDQDPLRQFELTKTWLKELNSDVEVELDSTLAPFLGTRNGPYADAASNAMQTAFGAVPAAVREGGSIGAVLTLHNYLKVPIVFLGLSLPEHGYHAANENFDWKQTSGGIRMFVEYFRQISQLPN